jgi:cobalt-zinc-cadmium efflux system membrane fusion protein
MNTFKHSNVIGRNGTIRNIVSLLVITIVTLLLTSCVSQGNKDTGEESGTIKEAFINNVKTEKPTLSNQEQELILSGKVECDPDKVVYYTPLISGVIERSYFALGDKVTQGQVLLDVRSADISAYHSEMIASEAEVEVVKRELQSAQALYEDKLLSDKELLEVKSRLRQTEAAYEKAKSDMSLYINKGQGVFAIKSPMTGYITDKKVAPGAPISSEGPLLFTVADLNTVWITVNVYAGNLQLVKAGMAVEITTLAYPDEVFTGKIDAVSQVFDPEEKVLKARIVMPNNDLKFKPEMFVMVKLRNKMEQACLTLSADALIFDDNRYFVVIETSPGKFESKEVQLQGHYQKNAYIRSGLGEDDKVVVKNHLLIYAELKGK